MIIGQTIGIIFWLTNFCYAEDKIEVMTKTTNDWRSEQWVVENFTGALGGGPSWGPVEECGSGANSLCGDKEGNIFIINGQAVDIVTKEGLRFRLAGNGAPGYRDGVAETAQFKIGIGAYYGALNIQTDGRGNIFIPDSGNKCIRRIYKDIKGKWMVDTWAGGGDKKLKVGESCSSKEINLKGTLIIAIAPEGKLTIATQYSGCYQVSPDGKTAVWNGNWPAYKGQPNPDKGLSPPWQGGDGDRFGNSYFISRTPDLIYKVTPDGGISHIGINPAVRGKNAGDGPPFEIYFDTPDSGCVDPNGSGVYICGGDEYAIRRVPTDLTSNSATLMSNLCWFSVKVASHGAVGKTGLVDSQISGKDSADRKPPLALLNCHIAGRDYEGNLYGWQYGWCGPTLSIKNKGYLGTQVYRIRRLKSKE